MATGPLIPAAWELRHDLSPYDAAYVALAQSLDCPLVSSTSASPRAPLGGVELIVPTG